MTKKENYAMLMEVVNGSSADNKGELIDFINREVDLLNRKSAKSGQTKTQKENVAVKEQIVSALREIGNPATVSEIMVIVPLSSQKISALLRQLVKSGEVIRTEEKKKAYFSVAE